MDLKDIINNKLDRSKYVEEMSTDDLLLYQEKIADELERRSNLKVATKDDKAIIKLIIKEYKQLTELDDYPNRFNNEFKGIKDSGLTLGELRKEMSKYTFKDTGDFHKDSQM